MTKLEASYRIKASRSQDWYSRMTNEQRAEYMEKYPGTKFHDKTTLALLEEGEDPYASRRAAKVTAKPGTEVLDLKIEGTPEALKTLVNLLAAIQQNTSVGHSCTIGAFFDGDGADKITVTGLPENDGAKMADACSSYGDGLLAFIGSDSALVYNTAYDTLKGKTVELLLKTSVFP